jgi:RecA-family ATPase
MSKLLDKASEEMQAVRYGGFKPKSMLGYSRQRLEWLWPNMVGRGLLHVFAGDSGIGKTLLLCDIAAIVSRGGIFPAERTQCLRGKVIYLSGEDSVNHTLGPRLEASGADMANVLN